jgi:phosphoribosylanthranilate isomerase
VAHRVLVKVCGVTRAEDAALLARAGVDAVGVIFAPQSRRLVSLDEAAAVLAPLPSEVTRVGVFASPTEAELVAVVAGLRARGTPLDVLQIHGTVAADLARALPRSLRLIRALHWRPGLVVADALSPPFHALLVDGPEAGSGVGFDWAAAASLRGAENWVLAGGLRSENVAQAVAHLAPPAVDVASGVELRPGVKDPQRLAAFLAAVWGER